MEIYLNVKHTCTLIYLQLVRTIILAWLAGCSAQSQVNLTISKYPIKTSRCGHFLVGLLLLDPVELGQDHAGRQDVWRSPEKIYIAADRELNGSLISRIA